MGLHVTVKLFNPQAALRWQQLSYTDVDICLCKKKTKRFVTYLAVVSISVSCEYSQ